MKKNVVLEKELYTQYHFILLDKIIANCSKL
jgi:hypothetical protein